MNQRPDHKTKASLRSCCISIEHVTKYNDGAGVAVDELSFVASRRPVTEALSDVSAGHGEQVAAS